MGLQWVHIAAKALLKLGGSHFLFNMFSSGRKVKRLALLFVGNLKGNKLQFDKLGLTLFH